MISQDCSPAVQKILDDNKTYLDSRKNEKECIEHGLYRYNEAGGFCGCILCPQDKIIGDLIMRQNIQDFRNYRNDY